MSLPALVVFSVSDSNNEVRYLSFTGPQRQLRFGPTEDVFSDIARFAVESTGDGLVHIRSCYENCYWARASRFEPWLVALSREKVEDMTKDECTLFRPRLSAGNVFVEFVHPQSGLNVVMRPATDAQAYNLCVEHGAPTQFTCTDFAVLHRTRLPRYVTFLGDNNRYLSTRRINENSGYLHFSQYEMATNREVGFEIFYNKSGDNIRVKPMNMNHFWCVLATDRRVLVSPRPEMDRGTLFDAAPSSQPNTVDLGIALRSLFYNQYCHRSHSNNHELVAGSNSPNDRNAWLRPMILGNSDLRRVNIQSFRHALRGPKSSRVLLVLDLGNNTNNVMEWAEPVQYGKLMMHTYSHSVSFIRYSALFVGRIPNIDPNGELEFPNTSTQLTNTWGYRSSERWFSKVDVPMKIPPMTTVTATLTVNTATFEVPFSYEQFDQFPWGDTETQNFHDGVFKTESDYGSPFFVYQYRPFNPEEFDGNLRKEIFVLEHEGTNNAQDDGAKPNVSDEQGINAQDDGVKPNASDEQGINAQDDGVEPNASDEVNKE